MTSHKYETVFVHEDNAFGELIKSSAHASLIRWSYEGILYEEWLPNDDFTIWSERNSIKEEDE